MKTTGQTETAPCRAARCAVHLNGREVAYTRVGQGAPIVLLGDHEPDTHWDPAGLAVCLGRRFRAIVPFLPGTDRMESLRSFLEGVGLTRPHVVAADAWVPSALTLAILEPDRIDRLAVLDTSVRTSPDMPAVTDVLQHAGQPLLVARATPYNDERSGSLLGAATTEALINFFSGATNGPA